MSGGAAAGARLLFASTTCWGSSLVGVVLKERLARRTAGSGRRKPATLLPRPLGDRLRITAQQGKPKQSGQTPPAAYGGTAGSIAFIASIVLCEPDCAAAANRQLRVAIPHSSRRGFSCNEAAPVEPPQYHERARFSMTSSTGGRCARGPKNALLDPVASREAPHGFHSQGDVHDYENPITSEGWPGLRKLPRGYEQCGGERSPSEAVAVTDRESYGASRRTHEKESGGRQQPTPGARRRQTVRSTAAGQSPRSGQQRAGPPALEVCRRFSGRGVRTVTLFITTRPRQRLPRPCADNRLSRAITCVSIRCPPAERVPFQSAALQRSRRYA